VYDTFSVHIIYTHEKLLHKKCGVNFFESTLAYYLVVELATLANLGYNVEVLLVLEHLVHLHNVWMIQLLKDVDFIHLYLLLALVHASSLNNLHSPLCAKLSVNTHTHLPKSTLPNC